MLKPNNTQGFADYTTEENNYPSIRSKVIKTNKIYSDFEHHHWSKLEAVSAEDNGNSRNLQSIAGYEWKSR